jgi:hypothetical protein
MFKRYYFLYNLLSVIYIVNLNLNVKEGGMGRECSRNGEKGDADRILAGKSEGNTSLGRSRRRRWVDNIKIDLIEIEWDGVDWIDLAQDRDQWKALVNTVVNLRVP